MTSQSTEAYAWRKRNMARRAKTIEEISHRQIKKPGGARTTHPIKDQERRILFKNWFKTRYQNAKNERKRMIYLRDYMIVMTGLYTAFRAEDLLQLKLKEVSKEWVDVKENKTGKIQSFPLSEEYQRIVRTYRDAMNLEPEDYLFPSSRPGAINAITRQRMDRVMAEACKACGIGFTVGMHGLRKTFGYCCVSEWGFSTEDVRIFLNHSSAATTEHYIEWSREDVAKEKRRAIGI